MAKFKVEVVCERTSRVTLEVEADSRDDAEERVEDILYRDHLEGHEALVAGLQYQGSPLVSIDVVPGV